MSMTTTHFTDALFEDLAETNYSTHKTIDWATLDREVKFKFGNNLPFEHLYAISKTSRPEGIELCAYNEKQQKYYELDNYDPKELIKKVQRFYASGKFYESKLNR